MSTPTTARRPTGDQRPAAAPCPPGSLPVPQPTMVRLARAHLTARYATGVDAFVWEARQHPMPDHSAIQAVIAASDRAQRGAGEPPPATDVAAALVTLSAIRLELDQTEARLLTTAQMSGLDFAQIAAILDLSIEDTKDRYRSLQPRLDQPASPPHAFTERAPR